MLLSAENVLDALSKVIEPDFKKDLVSLGMIKDLQVNGRKVSFTILLTTPACPFKDSMEKACIRSIHDHVDADAEIEIKFESKVTSRRQQDEPLLPGVKNIVAVASGKGGVGKSTLAANLAVSLAASGARVGLVDADIYGPSVPMMFDAVDQELTATDVNGKTKVLPLERYGVQIMSIGFFVDASKALIWRGPMASAAFKQLFTDVQWGELDYLLIDLPPGTGDIHLSMVQTLKLTGAIVVSTPQKVALADARKAIAMFENSNVKVKVLGMVENMAWFTPEELPDNRYYIFGREGCKELAQQENIPFLGQIPLVQGVCQSGDQGKPIVAHHDSPVRIYFDQVAQLLAREISIENARTIQAELSHVKQ
ncbi:MAG: Mrp/NBP35 family ATP-binding protein [Bacteroidales bacterium]